MVRNLRNALALLLLVIASGRLIWAQSSGGTIAGSVFDATGALVTGATLTATGANTGTVYTATSTSTGTYRFPQMQLGSYNLSVAAPGFKETTLEGVLVQTGSVASADVHLSNGGATETVTVSADAPAVETQSSDVGTVVTTRQILELPLSLGGQSAMRSVESFVFLAPGTIGPGTAGSTSGAFQAKTAGGQNFGTEVLLDGASVHRADSAAAFDELAPSVEALQEFKVTTSTIPAEYGRTTGGVENFSTKNGTNSFHGTAFDIFQNDALNANSYFHNLQIADDPTNASNRAANARDTDKKNDYGGSVGGPFSIPKLYNGHDRTFVFFSWEQFRQSTSGSRTSTVPTLAVRGGDFSSQLTSSAILDASGNPLFTDCNGNKVFRGEIFDPATTGTRNGAPCRNPFPGNIIPAARFSQVAKAALAFLPVPNVGDASTIENNFIYRSSAPRLNTNYSVRADQNLSSKSKVFVTYTDRDNDIRNGLPAFPGPGGGVQFQHSFAKYLRFGSDYVFNSSVFNHFNAGLNRLVLLSQSNAVNGTDYPAVLGIKGASGQTFPEIGFASDRGYGGLGYNNQTDDHVNALVLSDAVSANRGSHTARIGLDFRQEQFSHANLAGASGSYDFERFQTAVAPANSITGDGFASFLLGQINQIGPLNVQSRVPRFVQNYYAGYVQDDYKVAHNLLLNLGLRYDVETPRHEAHGNLSNFSPTTPNPGAGNLPGALIFAGSGPGRNGGSGSFAKTYRKDIAPRLGFAYAPDSGNGNTSIRGGFGIYYGPLDYAAFGGESQLGFTAQPSFTSPDQFSLPARAPGGLDAGIPSYPKPPNLDITQANGQSVGDQFNPGYIANSYGRPGMTLNWSVEVQQQLATDLILTVGYIGQSSSHLRSALAQINNVNPRFYSLGNALNGPLTSATQIPYANFTKDFPTSSDGSGGPTLGQALRPFPQYTTIGTSGGLENLGHSSYNAMTAKLERRFHSGLNLLASYTWSKTLTDSDSALPAFATFVQSPGSVQNPSNLKGEKSLSFQDTPHNFVVSYIYELPIGKGKRYLNQNPVVNAVAGGWQVGAVQRYLSGQPVAFACAVHQIVASDACIRNNQVAPIRSLAPGANSGDPRRRMIFNRSALVDPNQNVETPGVPFVLGNSPRVNGEVRTPIYANEDISLIKHIANFGEFGDLQLHTDLFNVTNRHHLAQPDTDPRHTDPDGNNQYGSFQSAFGDPRIVQFILRYTF